MAKIIFLILIHFFGDFFLQSYKLSRLKFIKLHYLVVHVGIYTTVFILLSPILLGLTFMQGLIYSLVNGALHLIVDYITGKYKIKFLVKNEYLYILSIGIDYTVHLLIIILTFLYMYPNAINSMSMWDKFIRQF